MERAADTGVARFCSSRPATFAGVGRFLASPDGAPMASFDPSRLKEGLPDPLGATWDGEGTNFALFSAHATKVEVCLFDQAGAKETARIELPEYTDQVFHGYLPEVGPG